MINFMDAHEWFCAATTLSISERNKRLKEYYKRINPDLQQYLETSLLEFVGGDILKLSLCDFEDLQKRVLVLGEGLFNIPCHSCPKVKYEFLKMFKESFVKMTNYISLHCFNNTPGLYKKNHYIDFVFFFQNLDLYSHFIIKFVSYEIDEAENASAFIRTEIGHQLFAQDYAGSLPSSVIDAFQILIKFKVPLIKLDSLSEKFIFECNLLEDRFNRYGISSNERKLSSMLRGFYEGVELVQSLHQNSKHVLNNFKTLNSFYLKVQEGEIISQHSLTEGLDVSFNRLNKALSKNSDTSKILNESLELLTYVASHRVTQNDKFPIIMHFVAWRKIFPELGDAASLNTILMNQIWKKLSDWFQSKVNNDLAQQSKFDASLLQTTIESWFDIAEMTDLNKRNAELEVFYNTHQAMFSIDPDTLNTNIITNVTNRLALLKDKSPVKWMLLFDEVFLNHYKNTKIYNKFEYIEKHFISLTNVAENIKTMIYAKSAGGLVIDLSHSLYLVSLLSRFENYRFDLVEYCAEVLGDKGQHSDDLMEFCQRVSALRVLLVTELLPIIFELTRHFLTINQGDKLVDDFFSINKRLSLFAAKHPSDHAFQSILFEVDDILTNFMNLKNEPEVNGSESDQNVPVSKKLEEKPPKQSASKSKSASKANKKQKKSKQNILNKFSDKRSSLTSDAKSEPSTSKPPQGNIHSLPPNKTSSNVNAIEQSLESKKLAKAEDLKRQEELRLAAEDRRNARLAEEQAKLQQKIQARQEKKRLAKEKRKLKKAEEEKIRIASSDLQYLDTHFSALNLDVSVKSILTSIGDKGLRAFIVGGMPRDALLLPKQPAVDIDIIMEECSDEELNEIFQAPINKIEIKPNLYLYQCGIYDITLKPRGFNLHQDALSRDTPLNAIYCDKNGALYFPLTESKDALIPNSSLSTIGDPLLRFTDDPIRILRLIQLSNKIPRNLSPEVRFGISMTANGLSTVPYGVLIKHLHKMLVSKNSLNNYDSLITFNILPCIFKCLGVDFVLFWNGNIHLQKFIRDVLNKVASRKLICSRNKLLGILMFPAVVKMMQQYQFSLDISVDKCLTSLDELGSQSEDHKLSDEWLNRKQSIRSCLGELYSDFESLLREQNLKEAANYYYQASNHPLPMYNLHITNNPETNSRFLRHNSEYKIASIKKPSYM